MVFVIAFGGSFGEWVFELSNVLSSKFSQPFILVKQLDTVCGGYYRRFARVRYWRHLAGGDVCGPHMCLHQSWRLCSRTFFYIGLYSVLELISALEMRTCSSVQLISSSPISGFLERS
jgi:hypothetical protein